MAGEAFVSWGQFQWIVGGLVSLNVAVFGYAFAASRSKAGSQSVERLWESHNTDKENLAAYKTQVAETYPTKQNLAEIENRITRHFDDKFADLRDLIKSKGSEQ